MIEQEPRGYLLDRYAISALTCTAAPAAGIDADRVKFKRTIRAVRRRVADPAFSLTSASAPSSRSPPTSPAARTLASDATGPTPAWSSGPGATPAT